MHAMSARPQVKDYSYSAPAESSRDSGECSSSACDAGGFQVLGSGSNFTAVMMTLTAGCPSFAVATVSEDESTETTVIRVSHLMSPLNSGPPVALNASDSLQGVVRALASVVDFPSTQNISATAPPPPVGSGCRVVYSLEIFGTTPLVSRSDATSFGGLRLVEAEGCPALMDDPCFASGWNYASDTYGNFALFSSFTDGPCPRRVPVCA